MLFLLNFKKNYKFVYLFHDNPREKQINIDHNEIMRIGSIVHLLKSHMTCILTALNPWPSLMKRSISLPNIQNG